MSRFGISSWMYFLGFPNAIWTFYSKMPNYIDMEAQEIINDPSLTTDTLKITHRCQYAQSTAKTKKYKAAKSRQCTAGTNFEKVVVPDVRKFPIIRNSFTFLL